MPHEVSIGKHPDIVVLRYYGDIESEDIITDPQELHLNEDRRIYLLADASEVHPIVPEGMWERVQHSIVGHSHLAHIAIAVKSGALKVLMGAVVKLSRQGKRMTLHNTYEEAESHLMYLLNEIHT